MPIAIQDVDLKLLRMFRAIVQSGGFSLAQARLNVSQSTISSQVAKLEGRLGVRLCERGHGVFRLTPEGEQLVQAAERLFAALDDFSSELAETRKEPSGELRIGLMDNMITNPAATVRGAIADYAAAYPDVRWTLHIGGTADLEERVLDSRLHLAVCYSHHRLGALRYQPLFQEEHLLYCGARHPFFSLSDDAISTDDIQAADYAGWGDSQPPPEETLPIDLRETASSSYIEGLAYLVLSGGYLAFLPSHYARAFEQRGEMRAVHPRTVRQAATFHLVTRDNRAHPLIVRRFIQSLGVDAAG